MPFWNPFLKVRLQKHQLYNLPNVIKVCPCTLGTSHIPYHGQQDGTQLFWKSSNALSSRVVMSNTYFDFQRCPSLDISYTYGHEFSSLWHPSACSALWLHSFHSLSTVGIWNSSVPRSTLLHFQAYERLSIPSAKLWCHFLQKVITRGSQGTSMWHDLSVTTKLYPEDQPPHSKHTSICKTQDLPYRRHLVNIYFQACVPASILKSKYSYKIQTSGGGGSTCL